MRLNTRNLIFIGVAVVVMVALILIQRGGDDTEPDATPTETTEISGLYFPDLAAEDIERLEIREVPQPIEETEEADSDEEVEDAEAGAPEVAEVVITKDDEDFWTIETATNSTDRGTDQVTVVGVVSILAELGYADRFSLEDVPGDAATFGLNPAAFEIVLADAETEYVLFVGSQNPGGQRYYVQTPDDNDTIFLTAADILTNVLDYVDAPPYVPPSTPTPTAFPTANPFSEVEQTATAQFNLDATATALAEIMPTATPEPDLAGPDLPSDDEEATEEATDEADVEMTEEATEEAADEDDAEMTEESTEEATDEADVEMTEEATEEATEESSDD
ncbi:MAG: DUF4340 domain-containing protein [Chloroflexota bacterium]